MVSLLLSFPHRLTKKSRRAGVPPGVDYSSAKLSISHSNITTSPDWRRGRFSLPLRWLVLCWSKPRNKPGSIGFCVRPSETGYKWVIVLGVLSIRPAFGGRFQAFSLPLKRVCRLCGGSRIGCKFDL